MSTLLIILAVANGISFAVLVIVAVWTGFCWLRDRQFERRMDSLTRRR